MPGIIENSSGTLDGDAWAPKHSNNVNKRYTGAIHLLCNVSMTAECPARSQNLYSNGGIANISQTKLILALSWAMRGLICTYTQV